MTGTSIRGGNTAGAAWAALLIVLALFARLLVPEGWMPAADGSGLVLCSGSGPMVMPMPAARMSGMPMNHGMAMPGMAMHAMDHGKAGHAPAEMPHGDHPCLFSSLSAPLATPDALPPAPLPLEAVAALPGFGAGLVSIGRGLAAPPPPPTGPPSL